MFSLFLSKKARAFKSTLLYIKENSSLYETIRITLTSGESITISPSSITYGKQYQTIAAILCHEETYHPSSATIVFMLEDIFTLIHWPPEN